MNIVNEILKNIFDSVKVEYDDIGRIHGSICDILLQYIPNIYNIGLQFEFIYSDQSDCFASVSSHNKKFISICIKNLPNKEQEKLLFELLCKT